MLKNRLATARELQSDFLSAERASVDAALMSSQALTTALKAHREIRLPYAFGKAEIALLAKSAMLAVESRNCLIDAHAGMAAMPRGIGIPERAWGDFDECPEELQLVDAPILRAA